MKYDLPVLVLYQLLSETQYFFLNIEQEPHLEILL